MEGGSPSNGGLLYHEVQESKLCAVHCVNTVLQGPFFSELDLAALASDLDQRELHKMMMMEAAAAGASYPAALGISCWRIPTMSPWAGTSWTVVL